MELLSVRSNNFGSFQFHVRAFDLSSLMKSFIIIESSCHLSSKDVIAHARRRSRAQSSKAPRSCVTKQSFRRNKRKFTDETCAHQFSFFFSFPPMDWKSSTLADGNEISSSFAYPASLISFLSVGLLFCFHAKNTQSFHEILIDELGTRLRNTTRFEKSHRT